MSKVIGVVGSRRRDTKEDFILVRDAFYKEFNDNDTICSGLCHKGGDWFAVLIATNSDYIDNPIERKSIHRKALNNELQYTIPSLWYPAEWNKYGMSAGFRRNTDIAKASTVLIACVSKDRTGGTEDTIKKFIKFHGKNYLILI